MNDITILTLASILSGMVIGVALMFAVLIWVTKNHDTHVKALKQEQRDSYDTYQRRINGDHKWADHLIHEISELKEGLDKAHKVIKENVDSEYLVESPLLDTLGDSVRL